MKQVACWIDRANEVVGRGVSWLALVLVAVIVGDVFLRYTFSITSAASFELEWHLFAALFMLSAGWAFQHDRHVRVDVFYQNFNNRKKAWINLIGSVFFLLPLCVVGVMEGSIFAWNAYQMKEGSPDPGGIPFRFVIKSTIPVGFLLLGIQGISAILHNITHLTNHERNTRKANS